MKKHIGIFFIFLLLGVNATSAQKSQVAQMESSLDECGFSVSTEQIDLVRKRYSSIKKSSAKPRLKSAPDRIPIKAHIIRRSDGSGGIDVPTIQEGIDLVNEIYNRVRMEFFLCCAVQYIDSDEFYEDGKSSIGVLKNYYHEPHVVNIYFFQENVGARGWASFAPNENDHIIIKNDATVSSTFPHELGHFFGLLHTHQKNGGTENVTRNPSNPCYNCEDAGDLLCSTAADPKLGCGGGVRTVFQTSEGACIYAQNTEELDECDAFYDPPVNNIMSYSCPDCRVRFTDEQYNIIRHVFEEDRSYLRSSCPEMADNLNLDRDFKTGRRFAEAQNSITASGDIYSGASVIMGAGSYIDLVNFHAQEHSDFHAFIFDCSAINPAFIRNAPADEDYPVNHEVNMRVNEEPLKKISLDRLNIFPNPFHDYANIQFALLEPKRVHVAVLNLDGKLIETLSDQRIYEKGVHQLSFNGSRLSPGVYLCRLVVEEEVFTKKLIIAH